MDDELKSLVNGLLSKRTEPPATQNKTEAEPKQKHLHADETPGEEKSENISPARDGPAQKINTKEPALFFLKVIEQMAECIGDNITLKKVKQDLKAVAAVKAVGLYVIDSSYLMAYNRMIAGNILTAKERLQLIAMFSNIAFSLPANQILSNYICLVFDLLTLLDDEVNIYNAYRLTNIS